MSLFWVVDPGTFRKRITMLELVACATCGKHFLPKRTWAKYCSPECKTLYYKKAELLKLRDEVERLRARVAELERGA